MGQTEESKIKKWVVYAVAPYASRNHSLAFYEGKKWGHRYVKRLEGISARLENREGSLRSAWLMTLGSTEAILERLREGR